MAIETDPNIIYGGDPEETTKVDENCPSMGFMVLEDLKLGENKPCFVSETNGFFVEHCTDESLIELHLINLR